MTQVIPSSEFEAEYAKNFPTEMGAPAKSFRMALGALIIKEKLGISDRGRCWITVWYPQKYKREPENDFWDFDGGLEHLQIWDNELVI